MQDPKDVTAIVKAVHGSGIIELALVVLAAAVAVIATDGAFDLWDTVVGLLLAASLLWTVEVRGLDSRFVGMLQGLCGLLVVAYPLQLVAAVVFPSVLSTVLQLPSLVDAAGSPAGGGSDVPVEVPAWDLALFLLWMALSTLAAMRQRSRTSEPSASGAADAGASGKDLATNASADHLRVDLSPEAPLHPAHASTHQRNVDADQDESL